MPPLTVSLALSVMRKRPSWKSGCRWFTPFPCKCRIHWPFLHEPPSHVGPIGVALLEVLVLLSLPESVVQGHSCSAQRLQNALKPTASYCSVMCSIRAMHGQMQCHLSHACAYISQLLATSTLRVTASSEALHRGILGTHCRQQMSLHPAVLRSAVRKHMSASCAWHAFCRSLSAGLREYDSLLCLNGKIRHDGVCICL